MFFLYEPGTMLYIGDFMGSITSSIYGSIVQWRFSINSMTDNYSSTLEEIKLRSMYDITVLATEIC